MEPHVLSDPDEYPSEEIIFSHIGKAKTLWLSLFEHIHSEYPDFSEEWRYYRDGKSWLMKVSRKKKTIFWLSIIEGGFRTTFYFNVKAEKAVMAAKISDALKAHYQQAKRSGKIHGLTILYRKKGDLQDAKALIAVKVSMK